MTSAWHPPIPSGALYSPPALALGQGLALLAWCYDRIERDGTIDISLERAAADIGKPYSTIKDWWHGLRDGPFFCELIDRGRRGWRARMAREWIDWRVMAHNYPSPQGRNISPEPLEGAVKESSRSGEGRNISPEPLEGVFKESSRSLQGRDSSPEGSAYKVLHDDQNPPSPSQPPRARGVPNREMVMMMVGKGIKSERLLNEIASMGLDLPTVEQSIDNLLADRTSIGAIVKLLQSSPPEPGRPYPRARAPASVAPGAPPGRPPPDISKRTNGAKLAELRKELGV